ncbi:hypothetical protein CAPTEDRAFT_210699 [Capitella teleta]|uniref:DUF4773 domain-containing protein n=1 Tax=Capitella teleta TaxID=283909 RepID=R7UA65_CAPTE|nr:hypothetical protein CAPTEDRAFT_210699 [Capitella teleta]|eukprot:ELU02864.1 hypothetical protein CAPTEDRAFT_210699 [Capitella teleta]
MECEETPKRTEMRTNMDKGSKIEKGNKIEKGSKTEKGTIIKFTEVSDTLYRNIKNNYKVYKGKTEMLSASALAHCAYNQDNTCCPTVKQGLALYTTVYGGMQDKEPLEFIALRILDAHRPFSQEGTGCQCIGYDCGCCLHLHLPTIHVNDTGCSNVTYLPNEYGISVTFDIDGHVIINETLSARNPPPICAEVPHLEKYASICIAFYDLDLTKAHFHGCMRLQVRLVKVIKQEVNLGCFNIPLLPPRFWRSLQAANKLPSVL